jgi:hypothetical protein
MLGEAYKNILSGADVILTSDLTIENIDEIHESFGGPFGTVPELLFEKKHLIPALQQLLSFRVK